MSEFELNDLKERFAFCIGGNRPIALEIVRHEPQKGLVIFNANGEYGVFVQADNPIETPEEEALNNMTLTKGQAIVLNDGTQIMGIALTCAKRELKDWFASICLQFLQPELRQQILDDPFVEFRKLMELTGNKLQDKEPRFIFAELLTYLYLYDKYQGTGVTVTWNSGRANHDIEASDGTQFEVKERNDNSYLIHISSLFQTINDSDTPFVLFFCKLTDEADGKSINDLLDIAARMGCDMTMLENVLTEKQHLPPKSRKRKTKFLLQEALAYDLHDEAFPKITSASFLPNLNLAAVKDFSYDVDLSVLDQIKQVKTQDFLQILMR